MNKEQQKRVVNISYELSNTPIDKSVKVSITKNKKTRELKPEEFTVNGNIVKIIC